MNRKHTVQEYLKILVKLRRVKSNIKFSSDFIIGYPGETHEDYLETIKLMKDVKFINSYSFLYSARPGTPAYNFEKLNLNESKRRLYNFQKVADDIKTQYRKNLINKTAKVLFENKLKRESKYFGRDEFFNSVIVKSEDDLTGKIINVRIVDVNHNTLFGEIISEQNQTNFAA